MTVTNRAVGANKGSVLALPLGCPAEWLQGLGNADMWKSWSLDQSHVGTRSTSSCWEGKPVPGGLCWEQTRGLAWMLAKEAGG